MLMRPTPSTRRCSMCLRPSADLDAPSSTSLFRRSTCRWWRPRSGVDASHFGIQVATMEDVVVAAARSTWNGLQTRGEEDTSCRYAVQDKVWVEDPDGNMWEVFVVKGDSQTCAPTRTTCRAPTSITSQDDLVSIGETRMPLRKLVAEALGTALLLAAVVGSGSWRIAPAPTSPSRCSRTRS